MLLQLPVRPEFTRGRGIQESLPLSGPLGIGETEQFLLQTLIGGAASFGGSFLGGRAGVASAASGGQTPAIQALAASAAPAPTPTPTKPGVVMPPAVMPARRRLRTSTIVGIGVGSALLLGLAAFTFMGRGK